MGEVAIFGKLAGWFIYKLQSCQIDNYSINQTIFKNAKNRRFLTKSGQKWNNLGNNNKNKTLILRQFVDFYKSKTSFIEVICGQKFLKYCLVILNQCFQKHFVQKMNEILNVQSLTYLKHQLWCQDCKIRLLRKIDIFYKKLKLSLAELIESKPILGSGNS